jgi:hypothetical protein
MYTPDTRRYVNCHYAHPNPLTRVEPHVPTWSSEVYIGRKDFISPVTELLGTWTISRIPIVPYSSSVVLPP